MNAKQMIAKLDGYGGIIPFNSEELEVTLRALRLLAAAEANDGSTPETNDLAALLTNRTMDEGIILDRMRDIERERNGLAAWVLELKLELAEITAAHHAFLSGKRPDAMDKEVDELCDDSDSAARSK